MVHGEGLSAAVRGRRLCRGGSVSRGRLKELCTAVARARLSRWATAVDVVVAELARRGGRAAAFKVRAAGVVAGNAVGAAGLVGGFA